MILCLDNNGKETNGRLALALDTTQGIFMYVISKYSSSNTVIFHGRENSGSKSKGCQGLDGGVNGELLLWGIGCFSDDENVLEPNSGNGCTTL